MGSWNQILVGSPGSQCEHTSKFPTPGARELGSCSTEGCSGDVSSWVLACQACGQSHQRMPSGRGCRCWQLRVGLETEMVRAQRVWARHRSHPICLPVSMSPQAFSELSQLTAGQMGQTLCSPHGHPSRGRVAIALSPGSKARWGLQRRPRSAAATFTAACHSLWARLPAKSISSPDIAKWNLEMHLTYTFLRDGCGSGKL